MFGLSLLLLLLWILSSVASHVSLLPPILALICWGLIYGIPAAKRLRTLGLVLQESGQLQPPPSNEAHAWMLRVCRFFVRSFVGKIELVGKERLEAMPGPFLLAFNHGSLLDVAIAPLVLDKRKGRYPAALGVMKLFGGGIAWLFGKWGAFPVDLDNGGAALKAGIKVMEAGEIMVIFPEAWTHMDGSIGPFKTGTVRIARQASQNIGKPVFIVPGYMHYGRYPGSWIKKLPIPIQWLLPILFAFYYRRGVKVVIGEPLHPTHDLPPADARQATEILKQKMIALKPGKSTGEYTVNSCA